ncbi:MAG: hypothetical protein R3C04_07810 [Hyphomonas sp.]
MKQVPVLLALSLCLAPQGLAREQDDRAAPKPVEASDQASQLSSVLETFVRDAIDEGLLTPTGPGTPAAAPSGLRGRDTVPELAAAPPPASRAPASLQTCPSSTAFDFSSFVGVTQYQQVFAYRDAGHPGPAAGEVDGQLTLAKAYVSLGMYSEAMLELKRLNTADAEAMNALAVMLERRRQPDLETFRKVASCDPSAGIWLAVARIATGDMGGAEALRGFLTDFRKLPLRLKIDLVGITVPVLARRNEKTLARMMISDFSEDQIAGSSELQFARAVLQYETGEPGADKKIHGFLTRPKFQEQALAALMENGEPIDRIREDVLLNELLLKFAQDGHEEPGFGTSVRFALKEFANRSQYEPIVDLAAMPSLQDAQSQDEIRRQLTTSLESDLASGESIRNLAAIDLMIGNSALLEGSPQRTLLYNAAARRAAQLGLASLAGKLATEAEIDDAVAADIAELAFNRDDHGAVYALAAHYRDSSPVNRFAARCAIRDRDRAKLATFESRLPRDAETILALVEEDAATGAWMVSDKFYFAAEHLTGEDHERRVERVRTLRRAAGTNSSLPQTMEIASLPENLASAAAVGGGH